MVFMCLGYKVTWVTNRLGERTVDVFLIQHQKFQSPRKMYSYFT